MGLNATARRRLIGGALLLSALTMLIAGETVLKSRLRELGFLAYWLLCFFFTAMAILVAYLDARALGQKTRREARELIETTLGKIEKDARKSPARARLGD
jgi:membrane protein implicated in regulation of membrane protease activity